MEMNLVELWSGMSNLVRAVVAVLTIQAVATIYVALDRVLMLLFAYRAGRKFAKKAGPLLSKGDFQGALGIAHEHRGSHLASYIITGVETFTKHRATGHDVHKSAELAARALERKSENLSADLNRGMNILASTGSTAPFVGLLGTVLGILNAFKLVSQQGSGGMGTIGVAIAEALIVTGYGLMVAIPSVLVFNSLSARLAKYEAGLQHTKSELVDNLDSSTGGKADGGGKAAKREVEGEKAAAAPAVKQTAAVSA